MYHGLRTDGRKIGLLAVESADFDEGEVGVPSRDGLEGEGAEASLPVDAGGVRRTSGGDGDEAVVFPVDQGGELAVAAEEVPGVDVDELKDSWIELHLEGHREDVAPVAEHDGYLEGAADGLVGGGRDDGKADGRAAGYGCGGRGLGCWL